MYRAYQKITIQKGSTSIMFSGTAAGELLPV